MLDQVSRIAIVGASGNIGTFMTTELLKTGKHTVTAITRNDSESIFPAGVHVQKVDYAQPETLVKALQGQDALVITMAGTSDIQEVEAKLVKAAAEASVSWILPNEWSPDSADLGLLEDLPMFGLKVATRELILSLGKSSYIAMVTGRWYEHSLARPESFGFNFFARSVTFFDDGNVKLSTFTWPQIGRAVAALLSLPVRSPGSPCLADYANRVVYISSFSISQRDMLASALRATDTKESDWTIRKVSARETFSTGVSEVQKGNFAGYLKFSSRLFFDDGSGDFEHKNGNLNIALGLLAEGLDEATKRAINRQANGGGRY